jgi:hypothetical protein
LSSKQETKSHDGTLHGGYSYVDANGHVQSVKYVADPHNGFQIVHATNLPKGPSPVIHAIAPYHAAPVVSHWGVPAYAAHAAPLPVQKTPEVLAAEHAHFAAVAEAKARLHHHHKRSIYEYAPAPVNGVPVDTAEVQHAKAKHFALVAEAKAKAGYSGHYAPAPVYQQAYQPAYQPAYNHYAHVPAPAPVNGVPVDTAEVQHAKAKHFAAVAEAKAKAGYSGQYASAPAYNHGPAYHYPALQHGVPEDTYEVKAEKAKHFALVAEAQSKAAYSSPSYYGNGHEDDGSYDARRYENEYYH